MNAPVKFELAKLLKEKGFDIPTKKYYEYALKSKKDKEDGYSGSFGWKKGELNLQSDYFQNNSKSDFTSEMWYMCSAPTIADVVMWLYEKHNVYIHISPHGDDEETSFKDCKWWFSIYKDKLYNLQGGSKVTEGIEDFNSMIEVYKAAIEYTLTKLI